LKREIPHSGGGLAQTDVVATAWGEHPLKTILENRRWHTILQLNKQF